MDSLWDFSVNCFITGDKSSLLTDEMYPIRIPYTVIYIIKNQVNGFLDTDLREVRFCVIGWERDLVRLDGQNCISSRITFSTYNNLKSWNLRADVWQWCRSPVNFPHKGQWSGALVFSLICTGINGWVNNGEAVARARPAVPLGLWSITSSLRGNLYVQRLHKFIKWFANNDVAHRN